MDLFQVSIFMDQIINTVRWVWNNQLNVFIVLFTVNIIYNRQTIYAQLSSKQNNTLNTCQSSKTFSMDLCKSYLKANWTNLWQSSIFKGIGGGSKGKILLLPQLRIFFYYFMISFRSEFRQFYKKLILNWPYLAKKLKFQKFLHHFF